jgi:hypothetical protein
VEDWRDAELELHEQNLRMIDEGRELEKKIKALGDEYLKTGKKPAEYDSTKEAVLEFRKRYAETQAEFWAFEEKQNAWMKAHRSEVMEGVNDD